MRRLLKKENLVALLFIIIGLLLLRESYTERDVFFASADELGPMTYPRYLLWGWVGLSFLYLFIPREPFDLTDIKASSFTLGCVVVSITAYYFMFEYLGLFLSTFLFLLIFFYILDFRKAKLVFPIAFLLAIAVWFVFTKLLSVPMPVGFWEQFLQ